VAPSTKQTLFDVCVSLTNLASDASDFRVFFGPTQSTMSQKIPSEQQLKEKWDRCIEGAIVKTSVGTVLGGLASLILFRTW
jgi:hypothetical protein